MTQKHIPYFSFYPADFMNGVRGLTAQDVGVYTMILCRIYEENGPVEYHVRRLSTYCGMREKAFTAVIEKLIDLGKLTLVDGAISNHRAVTEIAKRAHGLKMASEAGKASAKKRQEKQEHDATPVADAFNHSDTNKDTEKKKEEAKASLSDFDAFWAEVPTKVGKDAARKAFKAAIKKTDLETIIAGIRRYAASRAGEDPKYTAHPATWLRAGRWQDEPTNLKAINGGNHGNGNSNGNGGGAFLGSGRPGSGTVAAFADVAARRERERRDRGEGDFRPDGSGGFDVDCCAGGSVAYPVF